MLFPAANAVPAFDPGLVMLLCTRLCHDLSGPLGAIAAGVELMADGDDSFPAETAALLSHSTSAATARLKFLRAALGVGGQAAQAASLAADWCAAVAGGRIRLDWLADGTVAALPLPGFVAAAGDSPPAGDALPEVTVTCGQLLLNMLAIAVEAGASGAVVQVQAERQPAGDVRLQVTARGARVGLSPALLAALQGQRAGLTARTAQACFLALLAAPAGGMEVALNSGEEEPCLRLSLTVPAVIPE